MFCLQFSTNLAPIPWPFIFYEEKSKKWAKYGNGATIYIVGTPYFLGRIGGGVREF